MPQTDTLIDMYIIADVSNDTLSVQLSNGHTTRTKKFKLTSYDYELCELPPVNTVKEVLNQLYRWGRIPMLQDMLSSNEPDDRQDTAWVVTRCDEGFHERLADTEGLARACREVAQSNYDQAMTSLNKILEV